MQFNNQKLKSNYHATFHISQSVRMGKTSKLSGEPQLKAYN